MFNNIMYSTDGSTSGIFRGLAIHKKSEPTRVYIPGINMSPLNENGEINEEFYQENKQHYALAQWCANSMRDAIPQDVVLPAWVMYETGNTQRAIILGYYGKGLTMADSWSGLNNTMITGTTGSVTPIINASGVIDYSTWNHPLKCESTTGSATHFGAPRNNGRLHAGVDLITVTYGHGTINAPVYACQAGVVINTSLNFLEAGVGSVSVQHSDGTIIRYGEANAIDGITVGSNIMKGQKFAYIPTNSATNAMLHFEVYVGTASGSLSDYSNREYDYLENPGNYQRRRDLYDPTFVYNLPKLQ